MARKVTETMKCGVWMTANHADFIGHADVPDGIFAAIVTANEAWFTVDMAGNVRGNPEAVERAALSQNVHENLIALGCVGLARLALKRS